MSAVRGVNCWEGMRRSAASLSTPSRGALRRGSAARCVREMKNRKPNTCSALKACEGSCLCCAALQVLPRVRKASSRHCSWVQPTHRQDPGAAAEAPDQIPQHVSLCQRQPVRPFAAAVPRHNCRLHNPSRRLLTGRVP